MKAISLLTYIIFGIISYNTVAIPTIQHWKTDNGARVYFVLAPDLPIVDVEVVFDAGSARDGDKPGLATLTNSLLTEGAGEYSADQIAEYFDNLGARLNNSVDRDMATVSLRSLSDAQLLQPALERLAILLSRPNFEETSFERVRQQMLVSLKYQEQSPDAIAEKAFYRAVFNNHPYAHLPIGNSQSIAALTQTDLKPFHGRYYVAKNAIISIVGALDRSAAEKIAQILVEPLPEGETASALAPVDVLTQTQTIHLNYPSTQTHILIGQPGVKRNDPDYFSLYVGNYILGGSGLVSQLVKEIRQKRGLAYSAYSYFFPLKMKGPFIAGLETRNEQTTQALQVVQTILQDFIEKGPSEQELKEAKQGITGRFPLRIKSNSDIIGYLSVIGFYHLPLDYLHQFNQNIEAVTLAEIKAAFKRRLQLDKLVTVTVGVENQAKIH